MNLVPKQFGINFHLICMSYGSNAHFFLAIRVAIVSTSCFCINWSSRRGAKALVSHELIDPSAILSFEFNVHAAWAALRDNFWALDLLLVLGLVFVMTGSGCSSRCFNM